MPWWPVQVEKFRNQTAVPQTTPPLSATWAKRAGCEPNSAW
ncbi:Uncharacterised protein [Mycobacteroides abscessus subsp. abscessus]|nr:Uncharacterised protein [Mycobacteroides abscessus subsp. abscessus]